MILPYFFFLTRYYFFLKKVGLEALLPRTGHCSRAGGGGHGAK